MNSNKTDQSIGIGIGISIGIVMGIALGALVSFFRNNRTP